MAQTHVPTQNGVYAVLGESITQGMELFTALQRQGVPSKFLYYPDEGHWVLKPQNARLWWKTVLDWIDQWSK